MNLPDISRRGFLALSGALALSSPAAIAYARPAPVKLLSNEQVQRAIRNLDPSLPFGAARERALTAELDRLYGNSQGFGETSYHHAYAWSTGRWLDPY